MDGGDDGSDGVDGGDGMAGSDGVAEMSANMVFMASSTRARAVIWVTRLVRSK